MENANIACLQHSNCRGSFLCINNKCAIPTLSEQPCRDVCGNGLVCRCQRCVSSFLPSSWQNCQERLDISNSVNGLACSANSDCANWNYYCVADYQAMPNVRQCVMYMKLGEPCDLYDKQLCDDGLVCVKNKCRHPCYRYAPANMQLGQDNQFISCPAGEKCEKTDFGTMDYVGGCLTSVGANLITTIASNRCIVDEHCYAASFFCRSTECQIAKKEGDPCAFSIEEANTRLECIRGKLFTNISPTHHHWRHPKVASYPHCINDLNCYVGEHCNMLTLKCRANELTIGDVCSEMNGIQRSCKDSICYNHRCQPFVPAASTIIDANEWSNCAKVWGNPQLTVGPIPISLLVNVCLPRSIPLPSGGSNNNHHILIIILSTVIPVGVILLILSLCLCRKLKKKKNSTVVAVECSIIKEHLGDEQINEAQKKSQNLQQPSANQTAILPFVDYPVNPPPYGA